MNEGTTDNFKLQNDVFLFLKSVIAFFHTHTIIKQKLVQKLRIAVIILKKYDPTWLLAVCENNIA